jgi:hypothetical protein
VFKSQVIVYLILYGRRKILFAVLDIARLLAITG